MAKRDPIDDRLTFSIIGAFFEVYNTLGFGFLEHIYVQALEHELKLRGLRVARQVRVVVHYKDLELEGQRLDLVVEGEVVVETKSTYVLPPAATRQLHNYLRAIDLKTGLLLHFGPEPQFFRVESKKSKEKA